MFIKKNIFVAGIAHMNHFQMRGDGGLVPVAENVPKAKKEKAGIVMIHAAVNKQQASYKCA